MILYGIRSFRQRLRSTRQRPKSPSQRPTGQFANVRYLVLTEKKLLIDVCFGENWLLNTKVRWLPKVLQLPHQFGDKALRCKLTLYILLFFRSKQSLFLPYDRVRINMERSEVNKNSNFITIYSIKYLEGQKTYETYYKTWLKPIYIYLKSIYPIYREVLVRVSWSFKPRTSLQ